MTDDLNIHDERLHRAAREIFNITSHELSPDEINLIRYGKENVHYIRDCANNKIVQIAPLPERNTVTCTREVIEVTHPDARIEYATEENYLGFYEWKHDLIVESTRNDSGEPVLTGKSGAIYRLKKLSFDYPLPPSQSASSQAHLTGGRLPNTMVDTAENNSTTEEKQMTRTFTHPNLTHLNGVVFPPLPEHLQEFDKSETELQAMSYQDLDDATDILQDMEFSGLDHRTSPWIKMYAAYRNSSQLNGRKSWNESVASLPSSSEVNPPVVSTPVVEEKQMPTQVAPMPISSKSPIFLAAHEPATLDIIEDLLLNVPHDTTLTDDLILTIQAYIASEGKDGNKSHDELGQLARKAKMWGVFKLCGQVKGSDAFKALEAKYTPALEVTGGNQMGTVLAVGATAKGISTPIKEWLSTVTDTPEDSLKAVGLTKSGKPAKGGKGTKAAKEKAPKKEKVAKTPKVKEVLPLPTIADISALESMDRKSLQQAMSALNTHKSTGVKGNATSDAIKTALAKELLGVDNYQPIILSKEEKKYSIRLTRYRDDSAPFTLTQSKSEWMVNILDGLTSFEAHVKLLIEKGGIFELKNEKGKVEVKLELVTATSKAKAAKVPEVPMLIPDGLSWDEFKTMKFRDLQYMAKVFRSNGLYSGNLAGKGITKDHLLDACKNAMRQLGHEIIEAPLTPQNPDTAKPILERHGMKYDLHCQGSALLLAA